MGEEPAAIREAIEETREQMGDTLQQLADKADVKGRAKDWAAEKKDAATERLSQAKDVATEKIGQAKGAAAEKLPRVTSTVGGGNGHGKVNVVAMGKAGLTGVRAKVADKVSTPVAARTSLTEDQVEAIIGAVFLAIAAWQFVRLVRRVVRAGRTGDPEPS